MVKPVVVIRGGALGDVLWTTPVLRRLRRENPLSRIGIVTGHPNAYRLNVDDIEVNPDEKTFPPDATIYNLDMVSENRPQMHGIDAYFEHVFGNQYGDKSVVFTLEPMDILKFDWGKIITIHPNVSWPNRTLSKDWWGRLVTTLLNERYVVVATGTQLDHDLTEFGVVDLRDKINLNQQAWLISKSRLFICGDSSLFTLVGATNTPAIGFCTITPAKLMLPYRRGQLGWNFVALEADIECYGCHSESSPTTRLLCKFGHNKCVETFTIEQVLGAMKGLLS